MWHMPGAAWPTWWTYRPVRAPVLAGWSAGPAAIRLTGRPPEALLESALLTLAASLNAEARELGGLLEAWHVHDWPADQWSRGAYSYVRLEGEHASKDLAEAVEHRPHDEPCRPCYCRRDATRRHGRAWTYWDRRGGEGSR